MRALREAAMVGLPSVRVVSDPFAEEFYSRLGAERCGQVPAPMPGAPDRTMPVLMFVVAGQ
jgi:predicted N-acetyltransferase YhbS